jgi:hypothetical protein
VGAVQAASPNRTRIFIFERVRFTGAIEMSSEIELTGDKTVERFNSRYKHRQRALGFLGTAEGAAIAAECVDRLAAFIERELAAPTIHIVKGEGLRLVLQRLPIEQIALAALDGVLNAIKDRDKKRRRRPPKHKSDAGLQAEIAIGNALHLTCIAHDICRDPKLRRKVEVSISGGRQRDGTIKKGVRDRRDRDNRIMWWADKEGLDRWNNRQIVSAGNWALKCVFNSLWDVFFLPPGDGAGPEIYEGVVDDAAAIADRVLLRRPARFPSTCQPTPWTDWEVGGYGSDARHHGGDA